MIRRTWKALLPLIFIMLGVMVAKMLFSSRPQPPRQEKEHISPEVEVISVHVGDSTMEIPAMGIVIPGQTVAVQSEIPGRIVAMNKNLVPGGRIKKGKTLLKLDAREYKLAVKQQAAAVEQARVQLKIERSRGAIAKREWKLVRPNEPNESPGSELALRKPHMRSAKATLKAAESALKRAKITVEKATLKAPFNAIIQQEQAEIGQLVAPGLPIANLVGTDFMWVRVSVQASRIPDIQLPSSKGNDGAIVYIKQSGSKPEAPPLQGRVIRLLGDLDPRGRMARILVQVQDPLSNPAPLLLGSHADIKITGPVFENTIEVPRSILRDGDKIWLITKERTLKVIKADIAWSNTTSAFLRNKLPRGSMIISSHLGAPVDGMSLRLAKTNTAQRMP